MLRRARKPEPSVPPPGALDAIEHGQVKGWAWDRTQPEVRCTVELLLDGKPFQTVIAREFRADLLAAGVGDGYHAYHLQLPEALHDGAVHTLEARIAGTRVALEHSPRVGVFSRPLADPASIPAPLAIASPDTPHPRTLPDSLLSGLSVVIATKNNSARVERTLRDCAAAARNLPVEFIVVDYGSTDETHGRLRSLEPQIPNYRWIQVEAASPGAARNQGVALASREPVLFLGDDVSPNIPTFFEQHINAHRMLPGRNIAVLGKVVWPNLPDDRVSFLMSHLQGSGAQQFGFGSLLPYTWLDWRFFQPENVSFKRSVARDWATEGYRTGLTDQAILLEDAELAYRLETKLEGGFPILYYPAASVTHENAYTVRQFIERQFAAGLSARALFEQHAAAKEKLGVAKLDRLLASPKTHGTGSEEDLLRMIEGAKSWGVVIESNYQLGSQNWHADLLNAIFEVSYLQGYITGCPDRDANYAAAYRYCMERFQEQLSTAAAFEVFGRFPSFTLT